MNIIKQSELVGTIPPDSLVHGDCLEVMKHISDNSVDMILTDPPYFKVKSEEWDRQWSDSAAFLHWIGGIVTEYHRILKPNGSLYMFASPQLAGRVESKVWEKFNVLNRIRWTKEAGWHNKAEKTALRSFLSPWEEIIFAEHFGADNMAKGEAGYEAKCDELRGFVFEPLRAYLAGEFAKAGWNGDALNRICGTASMAARHYSSRSQWRLPTAEHYAKLQAAAIPNVLRREYEDLRMEYEDLRRPFAVTAAVPYTDNWNFKAVQSYPGKHPCEKPQSLLRHIIKSSSRPNAVVLDTFGGTFSTAQACIATDRRYICIEQGDTYFTKGVDRVRAREAEHANSLFA